MTNISELVQQKFLDTLVEHLGVPKYFFEDIQKGETPATVVIGRFQPFHNGHLFLVKEAKKIDKNAKVIVLIVKGAKSSDDKAKNPFPFKLQKEMIIKGAGGLVEDVFEVKNAFAGDWVPVLRSAGFEPTYWLAGADRAKSYEQMAKRVAEPLQVNIKVVAQKRISAEGESGDISATGVRQAIKAEDDATLKKLVPAPIFALRAKLKTFIERSLKQGKALTEMDHIFSISKKGQEFVDALLNQPVVVTQKLDGSAFGFKFTNVYSRSTGPVFNKQFKFMGREGKPIELTKRASMSLYEPIIDHIEAMFEAGKFNKYSELEVYGEYFPQGLKPLIPIKSYPKNSLVMFTAKVDGSSASIAKMNEIADNIDVESLPVIFNGKLNANQKQSLTEFIFADEETRKAKFKTMNFSQFILELLNPKFNLKINDEILEGVVFLFNGEKPITLKLVDPLFTANIKQKKADKSEGEHNAYTAIVKQCVLMFMEKHLTDIKNMAVSFSNEDDLEQSFIDLINTVFETYKNELTGLKNQFMKYKDVRSKNDLGDLFKLNPKFVSQEVMNLTKSYFFIEDMYRLILNHFLNPKRRAGGVFNKEEMGRLNKIINVIHYILKKRD